MTIEGKSTFTGNTAKNVGSNIFSFQGAGVQLGERDWTGETVIYHFTADTTQKYVDPDAAPSADPAAAVAAPATTEAPATTGTIA